MEAPGLTQLYLLLIFLFSPKVAFSTPNGGEDGRNLNYIQMRANSDFSVRLSLSDHIQFPP